MFSVCPRNENHYNVWKFPRYLIGLFLKEIQVFHPGVVVYTCNPSTQEAEAGGLWIQGSLGYIVRSCINLKKKSCNSQIYPQISEIKKSSCGMQEFSNNRQWRMCGMEAHHITNFESFLSSLYCCCWLKGNAVMAVQMQHQCTYAYPL
jgi:hypothetical protein